MVARRHTFSAQVTRKLVEVVVQPEIITQAHCVSYCQAFNYMKLVNFTRRQCFINFCDIQKKENACPRCNLSRNIVVAMPEKGPFLRHCNDAVDYLQNISDQNVGDEGQFVTNSAVKPAKKKKCCCCCTGHITFSANFPKLAHS